MTPYNMIRSLKVNLVYLAGLQTPLPVVTVNLPGGKKQTSAIIVGLACLWDIRYTNSMIKRRHDKPYKRKMCPNKVE